MSLSFPESVAALFPSMRVLDSHKVLLGILQARNIGIRAPICVRVVAMSINQEMGKITTNPFVTEGKALVSKVVTTGDVKADILKAVSAIGGFEKIIDKGDQVLRKPNYNTAGPPPASSDPEFLKALVELLFEHGAARIVLGESSWQGLATRKALKQVETPAALKDTGTEVAFFEEKNMSKLTSAENT
jgi:hypothetical protein